MELETPGSSAERIFLYSEILRLGLTSLRNRLSGRSIWIRKHDYVELAELLHYIPALLVTKPGKADDYFLRVGAKSFLENVHDRQDSFFIQIAECLVLLRDLVYRDRQCEWEFPAFVREIQLSDLQQS